MGKSENGCMSARRKWKPIEITCCGQYKIYVRFSTISSEVAFCWKYLEKNSAIQSHQNPLDFMIPQI